MKPLLMLAFSALLYGAEGVPQWVHDAAARQTPKYPPKVSTVVLSQEEHVTVEPDGRRTMMERGAIRFLQDRANSATAYRTYNRKNGRIREFHAWLVPPVGAATTYGKESIIDRALDVSSTYDESRARQLDCANAPQNAVFAWEIVEEEKGTSTQYLYAFQDSAPVLASRFTLVLPPSWEVKPVLINHDPVNPAVTGNTYTWELHNLPWIEYEQEAPHVHALAPRLAVSWIPSAGGDPSLQTMRTWAEVSSRLSLTADQAAEVTPEVRRKAEELIKGRTTELEKVQALARFAQQVNYVSIQMNLTRGGGYIPHPASQVLAKNYGDCKDKATLLRALLQAAGIQSHLVVIDATDRTFVRKEWPSPGQFGHAITAIHVSPGTRLPATLEDSPFGRLLFFDPTDPLTPLGDLPEGEQGSLALVLAGEKGELVRAPALPASANRTESRVDAGLAADGVLQARLTRDFYGQSARNLRSLMRNSPVERQQRLFESVLSAQLGGVQVKKFASSDEVDRGSAHIDIDFDLPRFGQILRQKLLILKPGLLALAPLYRFPAKERKWPIQLTAQVRKDSVEVKLPNGFTPDEIPDAFQQTGPYGTYQATWKVEGSLLRFEQTLEVKDLLAPAAEYAKVREFFDAAAGAQESAVVFLRDK